MLLPLQSLLLNLNRCLKYDGYWTLSDLLEIPNLRSRAFRHLGLSMLGRLRRPSVPALDSRLTRVYWYYGVPDVICMGLTLIIFGWFLARFLVGHFGWGGVALFLLWLALLFLSPLLHMRRWLHERGSSTPAA